MTHAGANRAGIALTAIAMMAALLAACANERGPHPNLPPLGARLEFHSKNLCGQGVSPEIRLGGVPSNTASFRLRLTNVSVLSATRWEKTIKAETGVIPEGSFPDYDAPCPGEKQTFSYRLEVMALAGDGQPIAYGWTFATVRSLTWHLEDEQLASKKPTSERVDRSLAPAPRNPPFFVQ